VFAVDGVGRASFGETRDLSRLLLFAAGSPSSVERTESDWRSGMPGFVQIMEFETSRIDEVEALSEQMQEERGDALLASKATVTEDRDRPGHYFVIVEFDSYEEAMKNSSDPVTGKYAEQMAALLAGPPHFHNLDVRTVMNVRQ
jgi:hypothetical protein